MVSKSVVNSYLGYMDELRLDTYLTVTFRKPVGSDVALHRFKQFFKRLNTPEHQFFRKYVRGFAVTERQGRAESVHIHAVIEGIFPAMIPLLKRRCQDDFGNSVACVYDYGKPQQATEYIAKKCANGTAEGWMRFKINSKWRG